MRTFTGPTSYMYAEQNLRRAFYKGKEYPCVLPGQYLRDRNT